MYINKIESEGEKRERDRDSFVSNIDLDLPIQPVVRIEKER